MAADEYVAVAEVARPHGVRGELRLKVYNLESDLLLRRPRFRLCMPDGQQRELEFRMVRRVPGALLVRLPGVDDREAAEAMRGAKVEVSRAEFGDIAEDEYFVCDLEGCEVRLDGKVIGVVHHVASYPTCDALVISRKAERRLEVPMQQDFIRSVDTAAGFIELHTIDGLE